MGECWGRSPESERLKAKTNVKCLEPQWLSGFPIPGTNQALTARCLTCAVKVGNGQRLRLQPQEPKIKGQQVGMGHGLITKYRMPVLSTCVPPSIRQSCWLAGSLRKIARQVPSHALNTYYRPRNFEGSSLKIPAWNPKRGSPRFYL